jgi:ketosteroid isomerase-like protein
MSAGALAARIERLEAIEAVRRLVGLYALAMDDRDTALVASIFAENALFRWHDDFVRAEGRDAIVEMFRGRFAHPSFHVTHDHLIELDETDPDRARGVIFAHAEAQRPDGHYVVATRYRDAYVREGGTWKFAERVLQHLYFVPAQDYAGTLGRRDRIVTPAGRRDGHWPEA